MSDKDKAAAEKAKNYSAEQIAVIVAASEIAVIDLDKAKEIGLEIGKSYRSVISKIGNLELPYQKKLPPAKKVAVATKSQLVDEISAECDGVDLAGLEKATVGSLLNLVDTLTAMRENATAD
jgi:hypothetical protein